MEKGDLVLWTAKNADGIIQWQRKVLYLGDTTNILDGSFAKISFQGSILTVSKKMLQPIE